jgi:hypothetical protein
MACCCGWFIHPARAISMNRNGSRVLGVCKVHYPEPRVAMPGQRLFNKIGFLDTTRSTGGRIIVWFQHDGIF